MSKITWAIPMTTFVFACASGPAAPSDPPPAPPAAPAAGEAEKHASEAHAKALAEVTRLRAEAEKDVLLAPWDGPYEGVPPWHEIQASRFPAAFDLGLKLLLAEVEVIATRPEPATFENTVVALEDVGRHQGRARTLFAVMTANLNTPEVQAVDREWSPKITAAYDTINFDERLFARIRAVHAARESGLTAEQRRLVERLHDRLVRSGAQLAAAEKQRLGEINQTLAVAFTDFSNKVLADEGSWVVLEKKAELAGLPPSLQASYAAAAEERKLGGKWVVVNARSSVDPFLANSARRDLREKVWKAFKGRGDNGDQNDTKATIAQIVALRAERAKLLGFPSHAHWRMADTMAMDPEKAKALMMRVWPAAVARVGEEVQDMLAIAKKDKVTSIEPWDYLYYAEKVRKAKYDLDQKELEPYFELQNMIDASFYMAEKLYGLTFHEITGQVPVFHPDVRVWEVKDPKGQHVGLFYGDYFARPGKRSGAWAMSYRGRETFTGELRTPITSNNNNFAKGTPGKPVLISLDDAETLFHEFGHGLHALLSEVNYPSLAGTPRDFVEYPSQVHEMWVLSRPVLDKYARHYQTGKVMPQKLLDKVEASSRFNQGYQTVEYLSSAILDMELHTRPAEAMDAATFESETLARIGAPRQVAMRHRLPQFLHLFSSDSYSAGYYSYLWSEVMDADTRKAFEEAGDVFDGKTAEKLRRFILAPGNTTDRAEAYRQFRGRDPAVEALLEKRGFPVQTAQ